MNTSSYILAIDQGTSSTKTLIFNEQGEIVAKATEPLASYHEQGFAEQVPDEIYSNVLASVSKCIDTFKNGGGDVSAIKVSGISNQRETFIIWDKSGKPLYNAVLWQCKRSITICERLKQRGFEPAIKQKTGLIIDPYFSGTKLIWLYENVDAIKQAIDNEDAYFGTVDTWLLYKLSGGKQYYTDYTNASRTMFFNLEALTWDKELLEIFNLSKLNLPECKPSSEWFGETDFDGLLGQPITISAMIGDSHAAAFGEGCFNTGMAKATLGTGCSILMNVGDKVKHSDNGMIGTVCWSTSDKVQYALEGVIVTCGATIEWLKNELGILTDSKDTEAIATSIPDNGGVYLVPAFSGLGAPHWDMNRKASITGLTFSTGKSHIVRAALESIPYQIKDIITVMEQDADTALDQLMIDGGISANRFIVQFLADLLGKTVINIGIAEVSALGAAYLAGLQQGIYKSIEDLGRLQRDGKSHKPSGNESIDGYYGGWKKAINNQT
ncbi:MAG: glycerol kinase GlpK [Bacteroidetes bacterium]|jgi:glycerol kinase|nr:glycerol kinase GlpK [Bacteroidota bacterium]